MPVFKHAESLNLPAEEEAGSPNLAACDLAPDSPGSTARAGDSKSPTEHPAPFYLMESVREGARLEAKTDPVTAEQQLQWTGLRAGMRALDIGCGTGAVTRVMATIAGPYKVVGVDTSASRLEQARHLAGDRDLQITFMQGDVTTLPLPSDDVDYTWSRFLFQYLSDPQQALAEMIRVTRPGGIVTVADLDGQIEQFYPLDTSMRADLLEALRLLGRTGFDPWVGRKLYHWFYQAGLRDINIHVVPYQVYAGKLPERDLVNWRDKLVTATPRLIELTGDRAYWERFRDRFFTHIQRPDTFYYCTLILVQGLVPSPYDSKEVR